MIPLYCIVDRKPIPEERVRRGAKTCDKECQKGFRRAFLLDRNEREGRNDEASKSGSGQRLLRLQVRHELLLDFGPALSAQFAQYSIPSPYQNSPALK
jgi:hypothetical protein